MQNAEPSSTQGATERMVKILDRTYAEAYLKQVVDNASQLNTEEITLLLSLLEYFKDLFDGILGNQATEPVNLELKTYYKPFTGRYYPVPRIKKETFQKQL